MLLGASRDNETVGAHFEDLKEPGHVNFLVTVQRKAVEEGSGNAAMGVFLSSPTEAVPRLSTSPNEPSNDTLPHHGVEGVRDPSQWVVNTVKRKPGEEEGEIQQDGAGTIAITGLTADPMGSKKAIDDDDIADSEDGHSIKHEAAERRRRNVVLLIVLLVSVALVGVILGVVLSIRSKPTSNTSGSSAQGDIGAGAPSGGAGEGSGAAAGSPTPTTPGSPAPSSTPPLTGTWTYLNCTIDGPVPKLFGSTFSRTGLNTGERLDTPPGSGWTNAGCQKACAALQYPYAGTEYAVECWCGLTVNGRVLAKEAECGLKCLVNEGEFCGGANRMTLWGLV
ncbi:hypothetical protein HK101_001871 [Irineochytrium annulatum]|nr:hypothetical protein HK101_001871 [Irineochytrium annulatum]